MEPSFRLEQTTCLSRTPEEPEEDSVGCARCLGNSILVVWQLINVSAVFGPASSGPLTGSIVWLLACSALTFIRMFAKLADKREA